MPSIQPPRWEVVARGLARPEVWLALGIVLFAGLYLAAVGPYWNISPDSARYVGAAQELGDGGFFEKLRFHPPVTALVFGAVLFAFPDGYFALNVTTTLLILLALWFAYLLLRRTIAPRWCLLIILLSLASFELFYESTRLLSEPVYLFASLLALLLLEPPEDERRSRLRELVGGGLLIAAVLTRTIGVTLALAVLLVEAGALRKRRGGSVTVLVLAGLALLAAVLWEVRVAEAGMSGTFKMALLNDPWAARSGYISPGDLMERMLRNRAQGLAIGEFLTGKLSTGVAALDVLLRAGATLTFLAGVLIALRRRVTLTGVYVVLYVAVVTLHLLKGNYQHFRHLVPVLPLLFFFTIVAVRAAARWITARLGPAVAPLLAVTSVVCVSVYLWQGFRTIASQVPEEHQSPFGSYPIKWLNADGQRLALWLAANSEPGVVYAAVHTNIYDLITRRVGRELAPAADLGSEAFGSWLIRHRVRFILLDLTSPVRSRIERQTAARPGRFRLIAELPRASLYQVLPAAN